ncbi:phosphotransferase [Oryctes borbonicus]|uniref:Phosphotransferase n=1 Tax=Oryctes borbonicus TaxID=1629725 RepID=A0A0T6B862_9SCAR|nr:phosphotransferase [Oryctes borbonicus]
MAGEVSVSEETKSLISMLVKEANLSGAAHIKYYTGSELGDGYSSERLAVDIVDDDKQLKLYLKCAIPLTPERICINTMYRHEIDFYKVIYPTYVKFFEEKGIQDGFRNVPKTYGFCEKKFREIIAFENLKAKGFRLFDTKKYMNDSELKLVLRTFAKFHAISFGIKDQRRELHDSFCNDHPCHYEVLKPIGLENFFAKGARDFVAKLDPVEDRNIIEKFSNLEANLLSTFFNLEGQLSSYSILTKFDCWINNMMVLYKDENTEDPLDIMLVDWQCITRASPVHDIGALFYAVASKEVINNYRYYLKVYYDELSRRIRELGSNPEILYPFSILEKEWKIYGTYSIGLAIVLLRGMLAEKEDLTDNVESSDALDSFFSGSVASEKKWLVRAKHIARHAIEHNLI